MTNEIVRITEGKRELSTDPALAEIQKLLHENFDQVDVAVGQGKNAKVKIGDVEAKGDRSIVIRAKKTIPTFKDIVPK